MSASATSCSSGCPFPPPCHAAPHILILGCGVVGMTCARTLQSAGFNVTIKSRASPADIPHAIYKQKDPWYTSPHAGAHWFSFAEEGEIVKQALDEITFQAMAGLVHLEPDCGLQLIPGHAVFKNPASLPWWRHLAPRFHEWNADELAKFNERVNGNYVQGYSYETVMIHGNHYLQWIFAKFLAAGGQYVEENITSLYTDQVYHIPNNKYGKVQAIVNCLGLGAFQAPIYDSNVYPTRGQVLVVHCPSITSIWRNAETTTYILPRGDGSVILGGTMSCHNWSSEVCADVRAEIIAKCQLIMPVLRDERNYEILGEGVGLRPSISMYIMYGVENAFVTGWELM